VPMITYEETLPVSQALTWRPTMAVPSDVTVPIACRHHGGFPLAELRAMDKNLRVPVRTPALDEETTVGPAVEAVSREPDISRRCGVGSIAQVDPGARTHRGRPLRELAAQARGVLDVAARRAGGQVA